MRRLMKVFPVLAALVAMAIPAITHAAEAVSSGVVSPMTPWFTHQPRCPKSMR